LSGEEARGKPRIFRVATAASVQGWGWRVPVFFALFGEAGIYEFFEVASSAWASSRRLVRERWDGHDKPRSQLGLPPFERYTRAAHHAVRLAVLFLEGTENEEGAAARWVRPFL
jgi:hypothetical protein